MTTLIQKFKQRNKILELTKNLVTLLIVAITFFTCSTPNNTQKTANQNDNVVISQVTTNQTSLSKKDAVNYFCSNLTDYFNNYKYYKISSEDYSDKDRQNSNSTSKITQTGGRYNVEYIGTSGKYTITFSNREFSQSEQIFTFGRGTILGNAIRKKVYDTYVAWLKRVEINLKATGNNFLYSDELNAAVELENWYNNLN